MTLSESDKKWIHYNNRGTLVLAVILTLVVIIILMEGYAFFTGYESKGIFRGDWECIEWKNQIKTKTCISHIIQESFYWNCELIRINDDENQYSCPLGQMHQKCIELTGGFDTCNYFPVIIYDDGEVITGLSANVTEEACGGATEKICIKEAWVR